MKHNYKIDGIHCPSCDILIEEKLEQEKGINKVRVNLAKKEVEIESDQKMDLKKINKLFSKNGYKFLELNEEIIKNKNNWFWLLPTAGIIILFLILSKLGLASFLNINSQSSLLTFFIFGIIAGFSSCGALLSGIIISYPGKTLQILIGRIISYTILGIILGVVGQTINIAGLNGGLIIVVSVIMAIVGLQMLGINWAQKIKINLPKTITKKIVGKKLPIIIGLLTVLLPCGFTLLAESVAMISGNWISGMLIMVAFVLGSSIPLFLIGLSSEKLVKNQKMMGVLILFFVLYNLNFQFGIINLPKSPIKERGTSEEVSQKPAQIINAEYTRFLGLNAYKLTVKK